MGNPCTRNLIGDLWVPASVSLQNSDLQQAQNLDLRVKWNELYSVLVCKSFITLLLLSILESSQFIYPGKAKANLWAWTSLSLWKSHCDLYERLLSWLHTQHLANWVDLHCTRSGGSALCSITWNLTAWFLWTQQNLSCRGSLVPSCSVSFSS